MHHIHTVIMHQDNKIIYCNTLWSSSSMPDCSVKDPRLKFCHVLLCQRQHLTATVKNGRLYCTTVDSSTMCILTGVLRLNLS